MRKVVCLIFLQALVLVWRANAQQVVIIPELPSLNLDKFSAGVRPQIEEAYADALAHQRDASANGRLGMVFHTYGLLPEAAICYGRASLLAPAAFRWAYYLGVVEEAKGDCNAAGVALRLALSIDPNYVPAQLHLGTCLLASAEWAASEELYNAVVQKHPDNAEAYYGLGRARASRHQLTDAAKAYRKACSLFPNFGAAHYALALVSRTLGQDDEAAEQFRLYEKNNSDLPPSGDQLIADVRALNRSATYQVKIGGELERRGRLAESVAAHERALEIDPQLVQAHINLIELYGRLGQFEKAEKHYRAAIGLAPNSAESYYNYGVLLLGAEKYHQAEAAFLRTIEINPFYASAHNNLGYLRERENQFVDAVAEYRKAIENEPSERQAHFNLGRVLVNQRKYREGIQELEKTLTPQDENTPRYIYALGAAFARSGDRQNALRYIRQARDEAMAHGQSGLVANIERDLQTLEAPGTPQ